jgi:hypothetical protein
MVESLFDFARRIAYRCKESQPDLAGRGPTP